MTKQPNRLKLLLSALGISAAVLLSTALPLRSQEPATGIEAAVSDVINQHIHSVALRTEDINAALSMLTRDTDVLVLESSSGYDQGIQSGIAHTHRVNLNRNQLTQLSNTGVLIVESEPALNHRHQFRFLQKTECPAMASPIPSPSPSVSPSISPSPEPSGSPSPVFTILSS